MKEREVAVVVGVGPGLGWALVKRFVAAGMRVAMAARDNGSRTRGIEEEAPSDHLNRSDLPSSHYRRRAVPSGSNASHPPPSAL